MSLSRGEMGRACGQWSAQGWRHFVTILLPRQSGMPRFLPNRPEMSDYHKRHTHIDVSV